MIAFYALFIRELKAYAQSYASYTFASIFLIIASGYTLIVGKLLDSDQANLEILFKFLPWLQLLFIPL